VKRLLLLLLVALVTCMPMAPAVIDSAPVVEKHVIQVHDVQNIRTVWIDEEFSQQDVSDIAAAIDVWNTALNRHLYLAPALANFELQGLALPGISIFKVNKDCQFRPIWNALAWADSVGGRYVWIVRDDLEQAAVKPVAIHELGHVLGANHTLTGVMQPHYLGQQYACIDEETTDQVAGNLGFPMMGMKFCETTKESSP
jgi:hypothetical protein